MSVTAELLSYSLELGKGLWARSQCRRHAVSQLLMFLAWLSMTYCGSFSFVRSCARKPQDSGLKTDDPPRSLLRTSCSLDALTHCSAVSSLDPTSCPLDGPRTKLFLSYPGGDSGLSCWVCGINQSILRPHSPKTSDFYSDSTPVLWTAVLFSDPLTAGDLRAA